VAETTVKILMLQVSTHWKIAGTSVSMLVGDTSRIKCFSWFEHHICDLFTDFPSYL
jgi:hypothetical protein